VSFYQSGCTLMLAINPENLEVNSVEGINGFVRKTEVHITVFGFSTGKKLKKLLKGADSSEKMRRLRKLITKTDWSFSFLPKRFHIRKKYEGDGGEEETRESVIQMIDLPGLEGFYQTLNAIFGTDFAFPPPHVTLFVKGDNPKTSKMGIGLYSSEDLAKYTVGPFPV